MIQLTIYGSMSQLKGSIPLNELRQATSYEVNGAKFSKAFRKGLWDGRKHLMSRDGVFPSGLMDIVTGVLTSLNLEFTVTDLRAFPSSFAPPSLHGVSFDYPYDYQLEAINTMLKLKSGIIKAGTGSGKTEIACGVTKAVGLYTLFCVTTIELLHQTRERFKKRLGADDNAIGIVGDGHWEPGAWVTVATVDTLQSRSDTEECRELLQRTKLLFLDEAHHLGSETWYDVATSCPAVMRFALTATPLDRSDGADLRLKAATGNIIVDIPNKVLVERGVVAKANIIFDSITEPILPKNYNYATAYKEGVVENEQARTKIVEWAKVFSDAGLSTLILVEHISHGEALDSALWGESFIPHQFISGKESSETRTEALRAFASRDFPVLISSTILDEGVDCPAIDALILAGSRKSRIKTMQRLGRGLRGKKLIAVEFINFCHRYLTSHSNERYEDYRKEDCFPLHASGPNLELVKKLWSQ
jgi:superfamily II DNA or RNA helicase